jgi:hypothetical protein
MILYDYVWTKEELKLYSNYQCNQKEQTKFSSRNVIWLPSHPDTSKLIQTYTKELYPLVAQEFHRQLSSGYKFDAKIAEYKDNNHYFSWHSDERSEGNMHRMLSTITYLNDDFESGETQFIDRVITPSAGKTLMFPSSFNYPHCGLRVTKGIKKILVMHLWV